MFVLKSVLKKRHVTQHVYNNGSSPRTRIVRVGTFKPRVVRSMRLSNRKILVDKTISELGSCGFSLKIKRKEKREPRQPRGNPVVYLNFLISDCLHPLSVTLYMVNLYPKKLLLVCRTSVAKNGSNGGIPNSGTPTQKSRRYVQAKPL